MTGIWKFRAALLTLIGAAIVHQARYLIAPPEHVHELAKVHHYLVWLMPIVAAMVFVAVVQFIVCLRAPDEGPRLPPVRVLWVAASTSLVLVFAAQETLELTAAHGELPGALELLQHLGWQLVPLALAVGGLLALILRGAVEVVRRLAPRRVPRHRSIRLVRPRTLLRAERRSLLARHLAGRAPPRSA